MRHYGKESFKHSITDYFYSNYDGTPYRYPSSQTGIGTVFIALCDSHHNLSQGDEWKALRGAWYGSSGICKWNIWNDIRRARNHSSIAQGNLDYHCVFPGNTYFCVS